jgi:hypothetical protein
MQRDILLRTITLALPRNIQFWPVKNKDSILLGAIEKRELWRLQDDCKDLL